MENQEYIGKVCPYCKTEFVEGDNIVVCSQCDMPHHRDCWVENQGCTTFGCQGTIKGLDGSVSSVTATGFTYEQPVQPGYAPQGAYSQQPYGAQPPYGQPAYNPQPAQPVYGQPQGYAPVTPVAPAQPAYNPQPAQPAYNPQPAQPAYNPQPAQPAYNPQPAQNPYGGQQAYGQNQQPGYGQQPYGAQDPYGPGSMIYSLIETKQEYYIPKFREMDAQNKKTTWNWASFLLAGYWLFYRKMYLYGAAAMGINFILGFLGDVGMLLSLGVDVALGIFGNWLYQQHLQKNIAEGGDLSKVRGTNTMAAVIAGAAYAVITVLLL